MTVSKNRSSSIDYPSLACLLIKEIEPSLGSDASKLPAGLYVVATPIGHRGDITLRALVTLASVDLILCEDTRVSGTLLKSYGIKRPLLSYHDHNAAARAPEVVAKLQTGASIALISDAGLPLIADPGFDLVRNCREADINVTVIPGANAALTALAGSGLPADRFTFIGFLPPKALARQKALAELVQSPDTLIFYEAPQRLLACLQAMQKAFGDQRQAAVARELTKYFEETRTGSLSELAEYYHAHPPKGEIVMIVGPAEEKPPATEDENDRIDTLLREALKSNSLRDAVASVTKTTGKPRGEVYARALKLSS